MAGGSVTFGRAFLVGLKITFVASACYVATWQVIYYKVAPDFGEKYTAYAIEEAKKSGATDAQIAATKKETTEFMDMYKNPLVNIAITFLEPLPVGLLFTLVSAGGAEPEAGKQACSSQVGAGEHCGRTNIVLAET